MDGGRSAPSPKRGVNRVKLVGSLIVIFSLLLGTITGCGKHHPDWASSAEPFVLSIATEGEFLAFSPTELTCPAGAHVRLFFKHGGRRIPQKHNWVLVHPGYEQTVEKAGVAAGEASGWLRKDDRHVLAASPLCSPGGEAVIEFIAPAPGDYPFICTTPGHAAEMHGVLHVTKA
jgi:azurin